MRKKRLMITVGIVAVLFVAMYLSNDAVWRPKPPPNVQLEGRLATNVEAPVEPEVATNSEQAADIPPGPEPGTEVKLKVTDAAKLSPEEQKLADEAKGTLVKLATDKGDIYLDLYDKETPVTVGSFLELVSRGFYDGLNFHRVIANFMIQGGDPQGTGAGGPGFTIPDEADKGLKHKRGTLSMAKTAMPNTGGSQFFICHASQSHLDGVHTVFGETVQGLDVVDKIAVGDKITTASILKKSDVADDDVTKALSARKAGNR